MLLERFELTTVSIPDTKAGENCLLYKGTVEKNGYEDKAGFENFIFISKADGATGRTESGNSGTDGNQKLGKQSCTGNGGGFGGRKEQRENHAPDSISNQHVPTLGELFSDYDRRNGKNGRKRTEKSEPAGDIPKRRKGIDR